MLFTGKSAMQLSKYGEVLKCRRVRSSLSSSIRAWRVKARSDGWCQRCSRLASTFSPAPAPKRGCSTRGLSVASDGRHEAQRTERGGWHSACVRPRLATECAPSLTVSAGAKPRDKRSFTPPGVRGSA